MAGDLDKPYRLAALNALAITQESAGQLEAAEKTVNEAFRLAEGDPRARPLLCQTLGLIALARKQWGKAREAFEDGLRALLSIEPADPEPEMAKHLYWALVQLHLKMGDLPETTAKLEKLLRYYPDDVYGRRRTYQWLGDCHADLRMQAEARRYYEAVLASPNASDEELAAARDGLSALDQHPS